MSSLENTELLVSKETHEINECLKLKKYLQHKYDETDRLQYHCAANIMHGVINEKIVQLKIYCREKLQSHKIRDAEYEQHITEDDFNYASNIGKLSKSLADLSAIDDEEPQHQGYPKSVVRQRAKTFTLTMSDLVSINIPSQWIADSKRLKEDKDYYGKNINDKLVGRIVSTILKTPCQTYSRRLIDTNLQFSC